MEFHQAYEKSYLQYESQYFSFLSSKNRYFCGQNLTTDEVLHVVIFVVYSSGSFFLLNNNDTFDKQKMDTTINT